MPEQQKRDNELNESADSEKSDKKKTLRIIRSFKRHYHKVRKIYEQLSKKGSFSFKLTVINGECNAQMSIPDEYLTLRFMVLMRRFLSQYDQLYYENFWKLIYSEFQCELSGTETIDNIIQELKKGDFGVNINGEDLTAESIYNLISNADYFLQLPEAQKQLQKLKEMPIAGPVLLDQFYGYSLNAFCLVSRIFDIVQKIEDSDNFKKAYLTLVENQNRCIYCLTETGNFTSEEHVFPESLGNDEIVLPIGYVCDKCNNTTLSELDNYFINFFPISFLRVQYIPFTKEGKLPKANFQNVLIEKARPTHIHYTAKDKTANIKNVKQLENGQYSFSMTIRGPQKFNPIKLGKSLYKIALGTAAFDIGKAGIFNSKYNAARNFVLGKGMFKNNFLMRFKYTPHPEVHITHIPWKIGTPFFFDIFGIIFLLNLEEQPIFKLTEELEKAGFKSFSLNKES